MIGHHWACGTMSVLLLAHLVWVFRGEIRQPPAPGHDRPALAEPDERPVEATRERAARTRTASGLYRQFCLRCHGTEGSGGEVRGTMPSIPDFTSPSWQKSATVHRMTVSILDGKGTRMPSFEGRVTDQEARELAVFVQTFGPKALPEMTKPDEFDRRFRELEEQWKGLQKQFQELSPQPKKP